MLYKSCILQPGINNVFSTKTFQAYWLHRGHKKPEYAQHCKVNYDDCSHSPYGNAEVLKYIEIWQSIIKKIPFTGNILHWKINYYSSEERHSSKKKRVRRDDEKLFRMLTDLKNSWASSWLPSPIWVLRLLIYIRILTGERGPPFCLNIITSRSSSHVRHQSLAHPDMQRTSVAFSCNYKRVSFGNFAKNKI